VSFRYAQLPVFKYRTFDIETLTYTDHPIIPPERINFSDHDTDDVFKNDDSEELQAENVDLPKSEQQASESPEEGSHSTEPDSGRLFCILVVSVLTALAK